MSTQQGDGFEYCTIRTRCRSFAIGVCAGCGRPTCDLDGMQVDGPRFLYFTLCNPCYAIPGRYEQLREQKFGVK